MARRTLQRAWSLCLAGPWTLEPDPVLAAGRDAEVDAAHVEAPSAYWWSDGTGRYFYMATPSRAQPRPHSPLGSAQATAVQGPGDRAARKLGVVIEPANVPGHWAAGCSRPRPSSGSRRSRPKRWRVASTRTSLLALPDGRRLLFYNTGPYAQERLFAKLLLD